MTLLDIYHLLQWFERADDLPPDQAAERDRILAEINALYERSGQSKERHR